MDPSIWDCLSKQNGEGILLTSCGAELQELMRQIDIMVRNKKLEWEAELASVRDGLGLKEQELSHCRALLDQKHQEVGVLKHQLESYETGQINVVKEYESQLNRLKSQLKNLKETHEKMQRQRTKRNQVNEQKESEMLAEIEQLKSNLKEKQSISVQRDKENSEWDIRKRAMQHQIECLEKQKRALASNYERLQQQLTLSQSRLKRSNHMIEEVESTSQSLLKKLEEELVNDKELIQRQESLIAELQAKTRELNTARHTATGEKYRYQEQMDKASCRLKVVEEEVNKLQADLSAREGALRGAEHEIADLKNRNEDLQACIYTKEKIIEAMQVRSPLKSKHDEVKQNVAMLEATVETMTKTEKQLREQVVSLESQLHASTEKANRLSECVQKTECDKVDVVNDEIRRLRVKLEEMEASHSAQLCGMKAEVTNLTSHLHGRDANITRLTDTCAEMERQLRDEAKRRDKLDAELQIAAANLQALREHRISDNVVSDGVATEQSSADRSLTEAEYQLTSLRENYGKAVKRLEDENQQLKSQVNGLKNQLVVKESSEQEQYSSAIQQTQEAMSKMKQQEDDRISDVCSAYEHRIASLEAHIQSLQNSSSQSSPSASCSIAIRSANSEIDSGTVTPHSYAESASNKARTPTPTNDFLRSIGIDPTSVNSSAASLSPSLAGSLTEKQLHALLGITDEGFDEVRIPTIEEFAAQEEKRVEQLESKIEQHIGDMKKAMDLAMQKYLKRS